MEALEAIVTRVSPQKLGEPGPTAQEFDRIIEAATTAPDHGRLKPWRFIMISGAARTRLGDLMAASLLSQEPAAGEQRLQAQREKALRAPAIVVVVATPREGTAIPYIEQIVAVGAATQNLQLAAHALGYGTFWRTGALAYDRTVMDALGLTVGESIIGFIYVGSVTVPGKPRNPVSTLPISAWPQ